MRIVIVLISFLLVISSAVQAQPAQVEEQEMKLTDAMESMLDAHPFRFSIFRVRPRIHTHTGYDSNGLNSSSDERSDYYASFAPGASVSLRFGRSAFLVIEENLTFLYYNELEQRRDIFSNTAGRFVTGSRKTLFTIRGAYVRKKEQVDSEFDVPADQKITTAGSHLEIGATPKMNIHLDFGYRQFLYEQDPEISAPFPPPPDNSVLSYEGWLDYKVHPRFAITLGTDVDQIEFLDRDETRNSYRLLGGLRVYGTGATGHIRVGYGETATNRTTENRLKGLRLDAGMNFLFRDRITLGISARRGHEVSRLGSGNLRITTEGQFRVTLPFGPKAFVDASYTLGNNDYGTETSSDRNDRYQFARSGFNYYLAPNVTIRAGAVYYTRDSSQDVFDKNRFSYDIGVNYQFTP
jgi:hypothetical protein